MWVENSPCTAIRGRSPGTENVWYILEANVTNLTRLFQTLFFYKIHNSYPNFLILYTKQSICSSLLDLFCSKASRVVDVPALIS